MKTQIQTVQTFLGPGRDLNTKNGLDYIYFFFWADLWAEKGSNCIVLVLLSKSIKLLMDLVNKNSYFSNSEFIHQTELSPVMLPLNKKQKLWEDP